MYFIHANRQRAPQGVGVPPPVCAQHRTFVPGTDKRARNATNRYNKVKVIGLVGLKEIRKRRGLNQQKVAMDLNITREALSQYENGKREPGQKMLIRMSEYFNVSIHYLITGHEFHKKHPEPPRH